jgi:hypothetical protein
MTFKHWILLATALILAATLSSCASGGGGNGATTSQTAAPQAAIPAASKFAKLQTGMARKEVHTKIGMPGDFKTIVSGKAWIPFYFGPDTTRTVEYYKSEGRLVYSGGNDRLVEIVYDPTEDGYKN